MKGDEPLVEGRPPAETARPVGVTKQGPLTCPFGPFASRSATAAIRRNWSSWLGF